GEKCERRRGLRSLVPQSVSGGRPARRLHQRADDAQLYPVNRDDDYRSDGRRVSDARKAHYTQVAVAGPVGGGAAWSRLGTRRRRNLPGREGDLDTELGAFQRGLVP